MSQMETKQSPLLAEKNSALETEQLSSLKKTSAKEISVAVAADLGNPGCPFTDDGRLSELGYYGYHRSFLTASSLKKNSAKEISLTVVRILGEPGCPFTDNGRLFKSGIHYLAAQKYKKGKVRFE